MNYWVGILFLFTLLIFAGIFRDKIRDLTTVDKTEQECTLIKKFLLNDSPLYGYNRPKLWIHSKFEINSRKWKGFLSRNTHDLNQPYLYLTIQSIVNHCKNDFHICLIDDDSFSTLLPSWEHGSLSTLAEPVKTELRDLAFLKLIYYYGGVIVPDSFLCFHSLLPWYKTTKHKPCIGQKRNRSLIEKNATVIPSPYFIASHKNDEAILEWIQQYEESFKTSPFRVVSAESQLISRPLLAQNAVEEGKLQIVEGKCLGIQHTTGKPIEIEDLVSEEYLDLSPEAMGIYIPADEILDRKNYQWLAYLSQEELLQSNMIIAKYIMASAVII